MLSSFRGQTLGPGAMMLFTEYELSKLKDHIELRRGCYQKDGRYMCYIKIKGNTVNLGSFQDAESCNARWDRAKDAHLMSTRKPKKKAHCIKTLADGTVKYKVTISIGRIKMKCLGTFGTKDEADSVYEKEWYRLQEYLLDCEL